MSPLEFYIKVKFGRDKNFARVLGIHPSIVSQIKNGYRKPWPSFRQQASKVLGVPEYLLFEENTPLAQFLNGSIGWDDLVAS